MPSRWCVWFFVVRRIVQRATVTGGRSSDNASHTHAGHCGYRRGLCPSGAVSGESMITVISAGMGGWIWRIRPLSSANQAPLLLETRVAWPFVSHTAAEICHLTEPASKDCHQAVIPFGVSMKNAFGRHRVNEVGRLQVTQVTPEPNALCTACGASGRAMSASQG